MTSIFKTLAVALMLFAAPAFAVAANLEVDFEHDPLFGEQNILPGDTYDGDVTVTNGTESAQDVYAESVNGSDPDGLGSQLRLRVLEGASVLYDDVFSDFLAAGPVPLSSLGSGDTTTYAFEVSFYNSANNTYQGKTLGFDLCIGFEGGQLQCGDTAVSEDPEGEIDTTPGGGGGGGGGSGGGPSGTVSLEIFNERVLNVIVGPVDAEEGTATIAWNTNLLATSQVVYGLKGAGPGPGGTYQLNLNNPPFFGYPMGTAEDGTKVINHEMLLENLIPGETYVFRVVSRASPPTVSFEHEFVLAVGGTGGTPGGGTAPTTPSGTSPSGSTPSEGTDGQQGEVLGESTEGEGSGLQAAAAAILGIEEGTAFISWPCLLISLLILVLLYLLWALLDRFLKWNALNPIERARRRMGIFSIGLIIAAAIALALKEFCILVILLAALLICLVWLFVLILRGEQSSSEV